MTEGAVLHTKHASDEQLMFLFVGIHSSYLMPITFCLLRELT